MWVFNWCKDFFTYRSCYIVPKCEKRKVFLLLYIKQQLTYFAP